MKLDTTAWRQWAEASMPGSMNTGLAALIRVVNLCDRVEALEAALADAADTIHGEYCSSEKNHHEVCAAARAALEAA